MSPEDEFYERKVLDEKTVPLNRVVPRVGDAFEYRYDFGDNWQHDILLEAILLAEPVWWKAMTPPIAIPAPVVEPSPVRPSLSFDEALPIVQMLVEALPEGEQIRLLEWARSPKAEELRVVAVKRKKSSGPSNDDKEDKRQLNAVSGKRI